MQYVLSTLYGSDLILNGVDYKNNVA